jgi:uncharacterized surface protein with fasciclin (FAS1) repeats
MVFSVVLTLIASAHAATLAQLIQQNPNLSRVAADIARNLDWSNPAASLTVIAPTNNAINAAGDKLPAGDLGYFNYGRSLPFFRNHYVVMPENVERTKGMVWDNYEPAKPENPEIHVRYGRDTGTIAQMVQADNGWLYVSNVAIGPPAPPSLTFPWLGCDDLVTAFRTANLMNVLEGIRGTTIFAPTNRALATANLAQYSPSQIRAILLYHIVPRVVLSSQMESGQLTTLLGGNTVPVRSSSDGADVGSGPATGRFSLADNFATTGIIHRLDFVLIPPNLPARDATVEPANYDLSTLVTNNSASSSVRPSTSPTNAPGSVSSTAPPASTVAKSGAVANGIAAIAGVAGLLVF